MTIRLPVAGTATAGPLAKLVRRRCWGTGCEGGGAVDAGNGDQKSQCEFRATPIASMATAINDMTVSKIAAGKLE